MSCPESAPPHPPDPPSPSPSPSPGRSNDTVHHSTATEYCYLDTTRLNSIHSTTQSNHQSSVPAWARTTSTMASIGSPTGPPQLHFMNRPLATATAR
ncbi:hypothetical protein HYFRA_00011585 [Hymenoscyphus fraxineus]|uniref:Uncharacterized protein n=1 Tax=Hymenoscyphus fraxineus TaxID=746836 RepID=A0A9N9L739_9HELO|nr:hypothetical protein HYFRA_00011585 [Hymenoscyphus fraxineus]